jgi:TRAP transporter TAXI family solute receptor
MGLGRALASAVIPLAVLALASVTAHAQTYGFATMQPGTLNHTTGSAIAKVLKEKAGLNVLVQPTAGESVIIPIVGRGEAELGMANAVEVGAALAGGGQPSVRLIGAVYPLRVALWARKDAPPKTIADLRGRKVPLGFSAMRAVDSIVRAMLATGDLTERDVQPVLVPNVVRSADDFVAGAADVFHFAFGAPKVREVEASVGGTRVLEIPASPGIAAAGKISPYGYLTDVQPGPIFTGVERPMKVYTLDNLIFTNARLPNDTVYKIMETMEKNTVDLIAVAPALREFSAPGLYKKYDFPYHPGALKYFKDRNIEIKDIM